MKRYIILLFSFIVLLSGCGKEDVEKELEGTWYDQETGEKWFRIDDNRMYKTDNNDGQSYKVVDKTNDSISLLWESERGEDEDLEAQYHFEFIYDDHSVAYVESELYGLDGEILNEESITVEKKTNWFDNAFIYSIFLLFIVLFFVGLYFVMRKPRVRKAMGLDK
ncbi:hypothetical protein [Mammaliicoccus sciuri]|uniref:hypothetical protein n=1 Tax=Mammaliicoccus sciuri TaxID=1296 RepID=UPI000E6A224A|nr:hypothetical protein [Mammaliicoccus sciuri]RIO07695.1 hypothetical protein BUZ96_12570 [Mammaliicoccus sciuri]